MKIPEFVKHVNKGDLLRIDVALEGNWNPTVTTIWTKDKGFIGFSEIMKEHEKFKPSIEIYFKGYWIGIHCFERIGKKNVFNEKFAKEIIDAIENSLK